jgi:predicted component of type VI protein secretion system
MLMDKNKNQISLHDEAGWRHDQRIEESMPNVVELRPELELAWRGLTIVISEGQMTRKQAIEMLKSWEELPDEPA